jgi:hypothetical protein
MVLTKILFADNSCAARQNVVHIFKSTLCSLPLLAATKETSQAGITARLP